MISTVKLRTLFFVISIVILLFENTKSSQTDENKPNIVIILADDMGFNDVSIHGSNQIPTPNIDALGIMGIQLNQMYVAPLCSPSRSALLTGKYPSNLGMQHEVIYSDQPFGLGLHEKTMADYMKQSGYRTYLIGKWHLGFHEKQYTPLHRGFDSHFGYYGPHIDYYNYSLTMTERDDYDGQRNRDYYGYDMRNNFAVDWNAIGQYATDLFTENAIDTINKHDKNHPLFMILGHNAPHAGNDYALLQAPEEEINKFKYIRNENRRIYAAMVSKLDESVGKVIEALEQNKMLDNSIILFMADNGAPIHGMYNNSGSNYPFKGQKASAWQGSIRSAAAIWSTRLNKRQRISNQMIHISDWLPTFAKISGYNVEGTIDGIDMWNALAADDSSSPRKEILAHHDSATPFMAYISDNFKLMLGSANKGLFDEWLSPPIDSSDQNSTFGKNYGDEILSSVGGRILSKYSKTKKLSTNGEHGGIITANEINKIRSMAKVTCKGHTPPNKNSNMACHLLESPCLFDIFHDPCETTNLARKFPKIVEKLRTKLNYYGEIAAPFRNKPADPKCNPANFKGTWTWWTDELNHSE